MTLDYDDVSYVVASDYRKRVLADLAGGPSKPSAISERLGGIDIAHVSRSLQELRDRDLVELLVSEDVRKGRIYGLTDAGELTAKEIEDADGRLA